MLLFVDVGWLGSPVDVATFIVVVTMFVYRYRPRLETVAAGLVALAERRDDVDDDRLRSELEVDDREVEELRPRIVHADGGDRDG